MRSNPKNSICLGFTLVEVVVLIGVLALVVGLFLYVLYGGRHEKRITCINLQKQIVLAHLNWAIDHDERFPMSVSTNSGGSMEWCESGEAWRHYQVLSNEIAATATLVCFTDSERTPAKDFQSLNNSNISYFVGLNARKDRSSMFLLGDRNLTLNGIEAKPGVISLPTNANLGWTKAMHQLQGNVGLADGSVQRTSARRLSELNAASCATNRLAVP